MVAPAPGPPLPSVPPPAESRAGRGRALRFDLIDLKILSMLERDARASVSSIAREVGLTENAVRYRIRKLRSGGILKRFVLYVDPTRLGHPEQALLLLKTRADFCEADLPATPEVTMLLPTAGPFQAAVLVLARDEKCLQRFIDALRAKPGVEEVVPLGIPAGADVPLLPRMLHWGEPPPRDAA